MIIRAFLMPLFFHVNILTKLIKYDIVIGRKDDCMDIQNVDINSVKGYYRNAKKHDTKQIKNVAESIRQFGFVQPIVIDKDGIIIIGHCRYEAAKRLRMDKVPCVRAEDLTDEQVQKLRLLDNKLNESEWDKDLLLEDVPLLDWDGFDIDWDLGDLDGSGGAQAVEDNPVEDVETRCKLGDIWQLGVHRLICGDATNMDVIGMLMDGKRADITFTSPPYNMGASVGGGWDKAPNQAMHGGYAYDKCTDDMSRDDYETFLCNALENALAFSDDALFNIGILCESKQAIIGMMHKYRDLFCDIIVWNKSASMPHGMESQKGMLSHRCEMIFAFNHNGSRSFTHPQWPKGTGINRIDTANASGNEYSKIHSATFPVEFAYEVIKLFSEKSCIDLFGGTGTTLIACEQLGRICYMSELSEHYCDTIIQRWENFTGETAIRVKEGGV